MRAKPRITVAEHTIYHYCSELEKIRFVNLVADGFYNVHIMSSFKLFLFVVHFHQKDVEHSFLCILFSLIKSQLRELEEQNVAKNYDYSKFLEEN